MKNEILVDIALRIKEMISWLIGVGGLGLFFCGLVWLVNSGGFISEEEQARITNCIYWAKVSLGLIFAGSLSELIPTPRSLFKTRVDLLKLELTNEENRDKIITKGAETIDKIVETLEKKYFKKDN